MSDDTPHQVLRNLHGPLCKMFTAINHGFLEKDINEWIMSHPNIYLEQQETDLLPGLFVVTLWYTEDSAE